MIETRVGFRPVGAEVRPLLGWVPGIEGLAIGNGLGAAGLTIGPFAGRLVGGSGYRAGWVDGSDAVRSDAAGADRGAGGGVAVAGMSEKGGTMALIRWILLGWLLLAPGMAWAQTEAVYPLGRFSISKRAAKSPT